MNRIANLRSAAAWAATIMDGVHANTLDGATTCEDWDLRALANHLIGATHLFAGAFEPDPVPVDLTADHVGGDPGAAFRAGMVGLVARFEAPDTNELVAALPIGTVPASRALFLATQELLVHGWDVARSTDQETAGAPQQAAADLLAVARSQEGDAPGPTPYFARAVPVDDALPAIDRLAAYRGRHP